MTYLVVLPVVDVFLARACLRHLAVPGDSLLVVDNSGDLGPEAEPGGRVLDFDLRSFGRNLGCAESWNEGARRVLDEERDWLIVLSEAFIPLAGLLDLTGRLDRVDETRSLYETAFGWHCKPIPRRQLEEVGLFDQNFWPAYYEDADFTHRAELAGWTGRSLVRVSGLDLGPGHGEARVVVDHTKLADYYRRKWGGEPGKETYLQPFEDQPLDWWPAR